MSKLIINADDFGYSKVFNKIILEMIEDNMITATSVMVDHVDESQKEQIEKLIELTKNHDVSVGLHTIKTTDVFKNDIITQYNKFKEIFNFEPHHIDIHVPGFRFEEYITNYYNDIIDFSIKKNIPCKNWGDYNDQALMTKDITYDGTAKNIEEIKKWLFELEPNKTYVAIFHPGEYDPDAKTSCNKVREVDASNIKYLIPMLKEMNIKLSSFKVLKK